MSADPHRARRRLPPEARRALIVEAARGLIAERGLAAATVREIADAAGVRPGTITHHFASIEELLGAVLRTESDRFIDEARTAAKGQRSAIEALLAIGEVLLADRAEARDHWRLWLDFWGRATHDPLLAEFQRERYRDWRGLVRDVISEGAERGELHEVDPDGAAVDVVAFIDGLGIQAFFAGGQLTPEAALRHFGAAVRDRLARG